MSWGEKIIFQQQIQLKFFLQKCDKCDMLDKNKAKQRAFPDSQVQHDF